MLDNAQECRSLPRARSGRVFRGVGIPLAIVGVFGSLYIDTSTGTIYEKTGPTGPAAWIARWVLTAPYSAAGYAFADLGNLSDEVGTLGSYAIAFDSLNSCSLGDAYLIGPKLAGSGSPGTWTGATHVRLSTVSTQA